METNTCVERKLPNWLDWYQPTCWWSTLTCLGKEGLEI